MFTYVNHRNRATDLNSSACRCTKKTLARNGVSLFDMTTADLVCMRQLSTVINRNYLVCLKCSVYVLTIFYICGHFP